MEHIADVLKPGLSVMMGPEGEEFQATISQASVTLRIDGSIRIQYLVAWWDQRCRKEEWIESHEVHTRRRPPECRLGFQVNHAT